MSHSDESVLRTMVASLYVHEPLVLVPSACGGVSRACGVGACSVDMSSSSPVVGHGQVGSNRQRYNGIGVRVSMRATHMISSHTREGDSVSRPKKN